MPDFEAMMAKARATNARRDRMDRNAGFAAPGDAGLKLHLRTALSAIEAGVQCEDWEYVCEGAAMIEVALLKSLRKRAA